MRILRSDPLTRRTLPPVRRGLAAVFLIALSLTGLPARAASTGVIEGQVLDGRTEEPVSGVTVTLTSSSSVAGTETQDAVTDKEGRYRFDELATGDEVVYALDAEYQDGLFPGRALTIPDDTAQEPVIETTLRVWPTTTDQNAIVVARNDLFVVESEGAQVAVIETIQLTNISEEAYIGRGSAMTSDQEGPFPSLGFALPARSTPDDVRIVDSQLDIPQLLRTDFGFGITTAIPPGPYTISFAYTVEGTAGSYDLSRRVLYPTLNFAVFSSENLIITSNRLDEKDETAEIDGSTYRQFATGEDLDPADSVQVIALTDAGVPAGLLLGMGGALLLVAALGIYPLIRSRRSPKPRPATREELLGAIAELDLRHERGEIDDERWARERAELKGKIGP